MAKSKGSEAKPPGRSMRSSTCWLRDLDGAGQELHFKNSNNHNTSAWGFDDKVK